MGMYGEEEVVVGLGENVVPEIAGLSSQDVSGIGDSNATENTIENAVKEGFATWKYAIIGVAGLVIIGIVVGLIFMCKKKNAKDESSATSKFAETINLTDTDYEDSFLPLPKKDLFLDSDSDSDLSKL